MFILLLKDPFPSEILNVANKHKSFVLQDKKNPNFAHFY